MARFAIQIALLLMTQMCFADIAPPAPTANDLHVSAKVVSNHPALTDIQITLQNVSDRAFAVEVGVVTNREIPAAGLTFALRDRGGQLYKVAYMGVGLVAGRIDPLVVDLPAHESFVFDIPTELLVIPPDYDRDLSQRLSEGASLIVSLDSDQQHKNGGPSNVSQLPLWKGTASAITELNLIHDAAPPIVSSSAMINDAMALLDRYWLISNEPASRAARVQLITGMIENHPDVCLQSADRVFINPDDKTDYAVTRELWLKQLAAHKDNPCFLQNIGFALSLTDREAAAKWLKEGDSPYLAELYANAIAGVTGMQPRHGATSFDKKIANSAFARAAFQEAMSNADLAGRVGSFLNLTTSCVRREKLGNHDFDVLAERLLLREAELYYPHPTPYSHLRQLYGSQRSKPKAKQIICKAKVVPLTAEELSAREVQPRHTEMEGLDHDVTIDVDVVVGIDGHVWKASPKDPSTGKIGRWAADEALGQIFMALRVDGQPAQIAGSVAITLYASPTQALSAR